MTNKKHHIVEKAPEHTENTEVTVENVPIWPEPQQPVPEEPPKPPSKRELLLKELHELQVPRPSRLKGQELISLLPYASQIPRQPEILLWTDLSFEAVQELNDANNLEDVKDVLVPTLALHDHTTNPKSRILLELYIQVVDYATSMKLTLEQFSAFFSIVKRVHEKSVENPVDNMKECLGYMDDLFARHCVKRPPWSVYIFDLQLAAKLRTFLIKTYFRHFQLYKYVFTPTICMDLTVNYRKAEVEEPDNRKPDVKLRDYFTKGDIDLRSVLEEIDLEDAIENALAAGLPPPVPQAIIPDASLPDKNKPDGTQVETNEHPGPQTELEKAISQQVDKQLQFIREKLIDKFDVLDKVLMENLGIKPPADAFAKSLLQPQPTDQDHHAGKKKPAKKKG